MVAVDEPEEKVEKKVEEKEEERISPFSRGWPLRLIHLYRSP